MPNTTDGTAKGSFIDIRRSATDAFVVTIDMGVTHHCANMGAVIELLKALQRKDESVTKADGKKKSDDGKG